MSISLRIFKNHRFNSSVVKYDINSTQQLTIMAEPKAYYQITNENNQSPNQIMIYRKDNDLFIYVNSHNNKADIVLQNYYQGKNNTGIIVGEATAGKIYAYKPMVEEGAEKFSINVSDLPEGIFVTQKLDTDHLVFDFLHKDYTGILFATAGIAIGAGLVASVVTKSNKTENNNNDDRKVNKLLEIHSDDSVKAEHLHSNKEVTKNIDLLDDNWHLPLI